MMLRAEFAPEAVSRSGEQTRDGLGGREGCVITVLSRLRFLYPVPLLDLRSPGQASSGPVRAPEIF